MAGESRDIIKKRTQDRLKRSRLIKAYVWLFALTFIFVGLVLLSHLDQLEISKLEVVGNRVVDDQEISSVVKNLTEGNHFYLLSKRNFVLLPRTQVKQEIKRQIPYISEVILESDDINHLRIRVSERSPVALWCRGEACYLIDKGGLVFSPAPHFSDNVFLKIYSPLSGNPIGKRPLRDDDFVLLPAAALVIPDTLAEGGLVKAEVVKAVVTNEEDYSFDVTQPVSSGKLTWQLLLDSQDDFAHSMSNLATVLASEEFRQELLENDGLIDYIDLRFGNKVFYKFKNQTD